MCLRLGLPQSCPLTRRRAAVVDEESKNRIKEAFLQYDRTLLVAGALEGWGFAAAYRRRPSTCD